MSVLEQVVAESDPVLAPYRLERLPAARFDGGDPQRSFVFEAVYEGYLMHYGEPRAFAGMDADLRLLAGDALYALGLARLAELGDLDQVRELADLISLCAWAEVAERPELAVEGWAASVERISGRGGAGARATIGSKLAQPPSEE